MAKTDWQAAAVPTHSKVGGDRRLSGGLDFDGLTGGCGDDSLMEAPAGTCTVRCVRPSGRSPVNISLRQGDPIGDGTDRVVGVEDVYANDSAPTVLEGDVMPTRWSVHGARKIYGFGGDDVLDGRVGNNTNDEGQGTTSA